MGWWLVLAIVIVLATVLPRFDYTDWNVIGGLLVLSLYVGVVMALAVRLQSAMADVFGPSSVGEIAMKIFTSTP